MHGKKTLRRILKMSNDRKNDYFKGKIKTDITIQLVNFSVITEIVVNRQMNKKF